MRIPKKIVGKMVHIHWKDPKQLRFTSHDIENHSDVPKGKTGLADWEEHGVIEKIEDDTVYLRQSIGIDPPKESAPEHELFYSVVPEDLIYKVVVVVDSETYPPPSSEPLVERPS